MNKSEIFLSIIDNRYNRFINIKNVSMNSKELEENDLFVAIRGGNKFLNEALEKGAYVVYDDENAQIPPEYSEKSFLVKDSVEFLQEFAERWRKNLNLKVIGITGSNGKTTVKDMVFHILSGKFKGKKTEGNYNNHIGLPFTLLRSEPGDEFIILEMGMSGFGEIDLLGKISAPDISIITNIGESHLEFLKTKENVFKAKTEILPHTKDVLVINGDDTYLKNIEGGSFKTVKILNSQNPFISGTSNFYYGDVSFDEKGTEFSLKYFSGQRNCIIEERYTTNVLGEHNILNLAIAISVAVELGLDETHIRESIKDIALTDMRFQIISKEGTTYINDAYNASPMSMEKSLETFSEIYNDREKIAVIGDMLELGEKEAELHAGLSDVVGRVKIDRLYLYGLRMSFLYKKLTEGTEDVKSYMEVRHFTDKKELRKALSQIGNEKVILIKGSRGMKLEEVIEDEDLSI